LPYATPADVYALIGESDAQRYWAAGTVPAGAQLAAAITQGILVVEAKINAVLKRRGYEVPVTPSTNPASDLGKQMMAELAYVSAVLAITEYGAAGVVETLPRIKELQSSAAALLEAWLLGTESLLDADPLPLEAEKLAAGRLGFAGSGERIPKDTFRWWRNQGLSGFGRTDLEERGPM
jgi:hypothetical protein